MNQPATTRRQNQRYPVDLEADVTRGETTLKTRIKNASIGGLFIELDDKPALGERMKVRFEIVGHVVDCMTIVRWHGDHGAGVQFDSLRARDVWALGKYFESLGPT